MLKKIGLTVKLSLAVIAGSLLIYLLVFGIGYSFVNRILYKNVKDVGNNVVISACDRIDEVVDEVRRVTKLMELVVRRYRLDDKDDFFNILKAVVSSNKDVFGISVSYGPYLADKNERYFSPYCYREVDDATCTMLGGKDYDYFKTAWYKDTKESGSSLWTDAYTDATTGGIYILSHSAPFYRKAGDKMEFEGVVSADISLDRLQNIISKAAGKNDGYAFLVSKNGGFITFPEPSFANKKNINDIPSMKSMAAGMTSGETGIAGFDDIITGESSWIFYAPVSLSDWSIGVVFKEKDLLSNILYIAHRMIALGLVGMIALFFAVFFISRRMVKPLNALTVAAGEVAKGDLETKLPALDRRDEIGALARSFAGMQGDLKQYIAELSGSIKAKERITNELKIAHDVQQSLVPMELNIVGGMNNVEACGMLVPALEVGGDLFDCFEMDEKHTFFVVGDVSDKGVHAAFMMAVVQTLLRGLSKGLTHPDELLKIINREVITRNNRSMLITLFCGMLNSGTGRFRFANAGHVAPVIIRKGAEPAFLKGGEGKVLGVDRDAGFKWSSIMLSPGDKILMYTDGVTEAIDTKNRLFGEERLIEELSKDPRSSPKKTVECVLSAVKDHAKGVEPSDDIALLCFKLLFCDGNRLNISINNDISEVRKVSALAAGFYSRLHCGGEFVNELDLAIEETVVNIIKFAFESGSKHTIDISLVHKDGKITATIIDDGKSFDPVKASPSDLSLEINERPIGGLGIELVKKMTDVVEYARAGDFNRLTLIKKIKR